MSLIGIRVRLCLVAYLPRAQCYCMEWQAVAKLPWPSIMLSATSRRKR
jgi:hypothetical protein